MDLLGALPTDNLYKCMTLGGIAIAIAVPWLVIKLGAFVLERDREVMRQHAEGTLTKESLDAEISLLTSIQGALPNVGRWVSISFWSGVALALWGMFQWYWNVQRHIDAAYESGKFFGN